MVDFKLDPSLASLSRVDAKEKHFCGSITKNVHCLLPPALVERFGNNNEDRCGRDAFARSGHSPGECLYGRTNNGLVLPNNRRIPVVDDGTGRNNRGTQGTRCWIHAGLGQQQQGCVTRRIFGIGYEQTRLVGNVGMSLDAMGFRKVRPNSKERRNGPFVSPGTTILDACLFRSYSRACFFLCFLAV